MSLIPKKAWLLCLFFLTCTNPRHAQRVWSQVSLDRNSAYVGQPVEVRISVYTSTWFTSGIDPGNIKVNGAFTVYFRPVSRSFQQDGQNYAGVELIYHVFPYKDKDVVFPSLKIEVETPPEGDFKGVKRSLKSDEKRIRVKPIPPSFSEAQWLVATGLSISEHWSRNTQQVKVGDVLERRISRTAYGTVAELIPPISWDSLPGVSLYPARSAVNNQKTKTAISASRTETMRYLFEQEGKVIIPEMVFSWYNPYHEKLYKRTLKEVTIEVKPNPDLDMLTSIRDSLEAQQAQEATVNEVDQPFTILGLSPRRFLMLVVLGALMLYLLFAITKKIILWAIAERKRYLKSEAYFFHQFKAAARHKDRKGVIRTLYRWIDELKLAEPSAHYFAGQYGTPVLQTEVGKLESQVIQGNAPTDITIKEWKKARRKYNRGEIKTKTDGYGGWINPSV